MRNPPSEPESGEIKEFSPPSDTKAPFCRQGSNRYFVNGLNDLTQMIDGADGAFAVFTQYQAHTQTHTHVKGTGCMHERVAKRATLEN